MGLCVTVPIVHPWIADRDFRKLLCDPQFKKFCPRFSGCDIDMNKEVITGLKCGVWFCSLCEYHMQDFLNGISPTLTYVMYLPITICKQFYAAEDMWQSLETFLVVTAEDDREVLLLEASKQSPETSYSVQDSPPQQRIIGLHMSVVPRLINCVAYYILGLYPLSGYEIRGLGRLSTFIYYTFVVKKKIHCQYHF